MAAFDNVRRMAADNEDIADFVVVYIEEAHPTDGWVLTTVTNSHQISSHRDIGDRLAAASLLPHATLPDNMSVVVDSMSDELNRAYGAQPERLYVIRDGVVDFEGGHGPMNFDPDEVDAWLQAYRQRLPLAQKKSLVETSGERSTEAARQADLSDQSMAAGAEAKP